MSWQIPTDCHPQSVRFPIQPLLLYATQQKAPNIKWCGNKDNANSTIIDNLKQLSGAVLRHLTRYGALCHVCKSRAAAVARVDGRVNLYAQQPPGLAVAHHAHARHDACGALQQSDTVLMVEYC